MIQLTCGCGHKMEVADNLAGKSGKCPKCKSRIEIPSAAITAQATPPTTQPPRMIARARGQEDKYKWLGMIADWMRLGGVIVAALAIAVVVLSIVNNAAVGSVFGAFGFAVSGMSSFVTGEIIRLLIDIEKNTRKAD